ncbi:hypothetical protein GCM10007939_17250 [Amylibacter marinus]|uniref:Asparaginase n=1 Tax=Amylibacter marinus TaxID=1475483 RepID=A0ABQ5VVI6_9RHOB|nr:asparaginase [Amylibacter marinus]GLQ35442.1 hypothetical protein GCM10007939_17250 [Amylibacter marinus]
MENSVQLAQVWRGDFLECTHNGHAVIVDAQGDIKGAWGNPDQVILPRSSCKILQAMPLMRSGAAQKFRLSQEQLALACSSHQGAQMHTDLVVNWLGALDLGRDDLRCGPQRPSDFSTANALVKAGQKPCQIHNNCSGKHAGFLTLNAHMGGDAEYTEMDHPVQQAALEAFEEFCDEKSAGWAIDGCSAPNFATSLGGLAGAMARIGGDADGRVLADAMARHPLLVAGEGRACSELMQACEGRAVVKTGAEGVFTAILLDQGIGIALKVDDGAMRGAEAAIAALLVRMGVAELDHPLIQKRLNVDQLNRRKIRTGVVCAAPALLA